MAAACHCGKFPEVRAENRPRVLVIDDEPLVRWSLVTGLRHAGFDAVPAADLLEAASVAPPAADVVLLDCRSCGNDPRQLITQTRSLSPFCRILFLTTEGRDVPLPEWKDVDVIRKPFDLNAVVQRVEEALSRPRDGARMAG